MAAMHSRFDLAYSKMVYSGLSGTTFNDFKPRLAEWFVQAGKNVAVVAYGVDLIFAPDRQHVAL